MGFVIRLRTFPPHEMQEYLSSLRFQQESCFAGKLYRTGVISNGNKRISNVHRFHIVARLKLSVGRNATIKMNREFMSPNSENLQTIWLFPLSGSVVGRQSLYFKDILGLTRIFLGQNRKISFLVEPSAIENYSDKKKSLLPITQAERRKRESDEEKYFIREYAPGDRSKDIHWKSSQRLDILMSKTSVHQETEIEQISIFFSNSKQQSSAMRRDHLRSILHLEALKSHLLSYVTDRLSENQIINVLFADEREALVIKENDDLPLLRKMLAQTVYTIDTKKSSLHNKKNWKIFTTPYDPLFFSLTAGDSFLHAQRANDFFITVEPPREKKYTLQSRSISLIKYEKDLFWPGWWIWQSSLADIFVLLGISDFLSITGSKSNLMKKITQLFNQKNIHLLPLEPRLIT